MHQQVMFKSVYIFFCNTGAKRVTNVIICKRYEDPFWETLGFIDGRFLLPLMHVITL